MSAGRGHGPVARWAGRVVAPGEIPTLDGLSGALLDTFFAYDSSFTGGIFVASASGTLG